MQHRQVSEKVQAPGIMLRTINQKCREFNKDLCMCFKDHSKAFDCVSHSQLWATLIKMGFPYRERI